MKLSLVELIMFVADAVAVVAIFMHRLKLIARKKINKQAYKRGHYAIAFLLAGMLELLFCIALRNGVIPIGLNEKRIMILMLVSGGTLVIGIYNMIRYYVLVSERKTNI